MLYHQIGAYQVPSQGSYLISLSLFSHLRRLIVFGLRTVLPQHLTKCRCPVCGGLVLGKVEWLRSSKCWGHIFWTPPRCACYWLHCNAKSWFVLKFPLKEATWIPSYSVFPGWDFSFEFERRDTFSSMRDWDLQIVTSDSESYVTSPTPASRQLPKPRDCSVTAMVLTFLLTALLAFLGPAFSFYDLIELLWPWHFIINHHCRKCWAKRKLISKILKAWIFSLANTSWSWIFPITYTKYDLHLHDLQFSTSPQNLCPSLTFVFHL